MHMLGAIIWNDLLRPPTIFGLGGIVLVIIAVIAPQWRRVQQTTLLARLTQDMLERGFSADEIERVLDAGARIDGRKSNEPARRTDDLSRSQAASTVERG